MALVVAGFYFTPVVLMPLLNGPLHPWGQALTWLWAHGEFSIPALVLLGIAVVLPEARERVRAMLAQLAAWVATVVCVLATLAVVGWVLLWAFGMVVGR